VSLTLRQKDWRLTAVLLLVGLLGLIPLSVGFFVEQPGHLTVIFRDTVFQTDITTRRSVLAIDGRVISASVRASKEGAAFDLGTVPASAHSVRWEIDGFGKGERTVTVYPMREGESSLVIDLKPQFGRVEVQGTDAVTNERLTVPAEVNLGAGRQEMRSATILFADVSPGLHTVRMQAEGYCPEERTVSVSAGETAKASVALSPSLGRDEAARIILEWNHAPDDLDAHVYINLADEKSERHVYWNAMQSDKGGQRVVSLDVDKRTPGGFETVTIRQGFPGQYTYMIHNYSLWRAMRIKGPLPPNMAAADPRVRLYVSGDCKPRVFQLPAFHNDLGWMVVELIVDENGFISVVSPQMKSRAPLDKTSPRK